MPLFDQPYNFARWLAQNRQEAEDPSERIKRLGTVGFFNFVMFTPPLRYKVNPTGQAGLPTLLAFQETHD